MTTEDEAWAGLAVDPSVLLWDKAPGETSHDVVEEVRRRTGMKVGHAGTLDPFASGLLVILIGRATRLQRFFMALPKSYLATARLGWRSSTGDRDGILEETGTTPDPIEIPIGECDQMVPMTSAARVGGERLYRKAHRGETVEERPVRRVTVHRAELLSREGDRAEFVLEVSSGTYVRNLIEDLGDAYCDQLRRTAIGPLEIEGAGTALTPLEALRFLPNRELEEDELAGVRNGRSVPYDRDSPASPGAVTISFEGRLIAVGEPIDRVLRPTVVLEAGGE